MRRFCKRALAVLTAAAMLSAGSSALAAEGDAGISVQLDGQTLTFSDAAPEARDGRTFLPVRAVFEAMGAQVSYDAAAGTVTAVRDGTTVTMTLGSTEASVSMDGITTPVVMDVAPYAHDNRTYVPVRFAAQAFGCIVGWDADDRTVILIDAEKLVEDTIAKYDYTLLEKYLAYGQTYSTGIWDMEAAFDAELALGVAPITMDGELTGTVADGMQMDAAMALRMDLQELLGSLTEGAGGGMSATDTALLDSLADEGIAMDIRGDLERGQLYFRFGGDFMTTALGVDENTWFSMDMAAMYEAMGMDYSGLLSMAAGDVDYSGLLSTLLALAVTEPTDKDTAWADLSAAVDLAAQMLRDDAWTASGNDRILHYAPEMDGLAADLTFTLTLDGEDVTAYDLAAEITATDPDSGMAVSLTVAEAMDADGNMTASLSMGMGDILSMTMDMTGAYTQGTSAPETQPPEGAAVVDLLEMGTAVPEAQPAE